MTLEAVAHGRMVRITVGKYRLGAVARNPDEASQWARAITAAVSDTTLDQLERLEDLLDRADNRLSRNIDREDALAMATTKKSADETPAVDIPVADRIRHAMVILQSCITDLEPEKTIAAEARKEALVDAGRIATETGNAKVASAIQKLIDIEAGGGNPQA